ncbi:MAG: PAS domain S-box protein [Halanaerobacter sp.]
MEEILVVEDSKVDQKKLESDLRQLGFRILEIIASRKEAVKFIENNSPDLIIMDVVLEGSMTGLNVTEKITAKTNIPIIYLTEEGESYRDFSSNTVYLSKPFTKSELKNNIDILLEKRKIKEELRENKRFLENIFDSIQAGLVVLDTELKIVRINQWIKDLYETNDSLLGKKCYEAFHHRDTPCEDCPVVNTLESGEVRSGELIIEDGVHLELYAYPLINKSGEIEGVIEYTNDITERKQTEQELEHVNDIIESSPAILFKWNSEDWEVEFVSKNIEQFGYKQEELENKKILFADMVYEEDLERIKKEVKTYSKEGKDRFKQHYRILTAEGEIRWIDDWTIIIRDEAGEITHYHGIVIDVSERVRAEQKIRDNEKRWKFALESSNYGIWDWNLHAGEVYFSPIWKEMLGYAPGEIPDQIDEWTDRVHPNDINETMFKVREHLAGEKEYYQDEHRMQHKDGHYIWIQDRGKVVERAADGKPLRFIGTHEDITAKKEMEEKLKEREERLNLAMDAAEHGFWDWDLDNDEVYFSPRYFTMLGYEPGELPMSFEIWIELLHPEDKERILPEVKEKIANGIPFEVEFRLQTKDGAWKWIMGKGKSYNLDEAGEPHRAVGTHTDITERKKIEKELKESEERYRGLVESQQDLIVRVDADGSFTYVNQAYCETFGKSKEELIGSSFTPLIHEDDQEEPLEAMEELKIPPYRFYVEQRVMTVDGWRWIAWEDYAIRDEDGEIKEVQGVGRDITDLKEAQQEAEAANRAKSEFLANMSHEIRTPLSAVIGFSELLEKMTDDDKQLDYLESIKTAGNTLLTLINDILDLSKIEAGQLEINYEKFALIPLLEEIKQIFKQKADEKNLNFALEIEVDKIAIRLDETRLRQILLNLVGNAVKFTKQGHVKLKVVSNYNINNELDLRIIVVDSGIGIADNEQDNIFNAFQQQDGQSTREYGGTGLGLAITKRLVEIMEGSLTLESEEGVGSTFIIEFTDLEYEKLETEQRDENKQRYIKFYPAKILIADDIESNRNLLKAIFKDYALELTTAENGQEAVELANRVEFDLILMDLKMPKMDGYEAVERIKDNSKNEVTPILALTAAVTEKEKEEVKRNEFAEFMSKPINRENLLTRLTHYLEHEKEMVETKVQEEDEMIKEEIPSAVINRLKEEFLPQQRKVKKAFIINEVEEFADRLYDLSREHNINLLEEYAKGLKKDLRNFNLERAKESFNQFGDIINELNN